jgi:1,4-dihydroxy-2-naphthoyl-CoA hydrolase
MSIWIQRPSIEILQERSRGSMSDFLGIRFVEVGDDFLSASMPVDGRTRQPAGVVHGGASVALAETIASVAANCCVDMTRYQCFGQEINANHLRTVREGSVTGTTRPFHVGARTQVWGIEIRNEAGQLTCVARITMATVERRA